MKEIYKGTLCGGYSAKVFLDFKECGSSIEFPNQEEPYCIIKIGCAFGDWVEVFDGVLHEMMEFHMGNMECCYQRWFRAGCDTGDIWFSMSHGEYSEIISRTSQSMMMFIDKAKEEYFKHKEAEEKEADDKATRKTIKKTEETSTDERNTEPESRS